MFGVHYTVQQVQPVPKGYTFANSGEYGKARMRQATGIHPVPTFTQQRVVHKVYTFANIGEYGQHARPQRQVTFVHHAPQQSFAQPSFGQPRHHHHHHRYRETSFLQPIPGVAPCDPSIDQRAAALNRIRAEGTYNSGNSNNVMSGINNPMAAPLPPGFDCKITNPPNMILFRKKALGVPDTVDQADARTQHEIQQLTQCLQQHNLLQGPLQKLSNGGGQSDGIFLMGDNMIVKVSRDRRIPGLESEPDRIRRHLQQHGPQIANEQDFIYPSRHLLAKEEAPGGGELGKIDIYVMRRATGVSMTEVMHNCGLRRFSQEEQMSALRELGRVLRRLNTQYGNHADLNTENVLYDPANAKITLIDVGGLGTQTSDSDVEHFCESCLKITQYKDASAERRADIERIVKSFGEGYYGRQMTTFSELNTAIHKETSIGQHWFWDPLQRMWNR